VGGTYDMHGVGERCLQGSDWEAQRRETTGKTGICERITLRWALGR
jgi:hypothetical protein